MLFLVIFALVFTATTKVAGGSIDTSPYYVPVIITLAIISAAFGKSRSASWTPTSTHLRWLCRISGGDGA